VTENAIRKKVCFFAFKKKKLFFLKAECNLDVHKTTHSSARIEHVPSLPGGANAHISLAGIEPESGMSIIQNIIESAQKSLWIEMYLFDNDAIAQMLLRKKAEHPSFDLRLLYHHPELPLSLDPTRSRRFPHWVQPNKGIRVDGEPVTMHHAKLLLVDADVAGHGKAYIMTANFTAQALGGNHAGYANREYILCDTDPADIALLKAVFLADQAGKHLPAIPSTSNLVISDVNAIAVVPALLQSAKRSIAIQVEYLNDPPGHGTLDLKQLLLHAASQGVNVQLMLPPLSPMSPGGPTADNHETYHALAPHVAVNVTPQYFIHAKMVIIDKHLAFVGSQNLSHQSLRYSRELGILVSNKTVVSHLLKTFDADWEYAQALAKKHHTSR
jgi:phosphatidylserine/phosphatidylglycerophosphate/cardiolipin synthase-like enzyme